MYRGRSPELTGGAKLPDRRSGESIVLNTPAKRSSDHISSLDGATRLYAALRATPPLKVQSSERDMLWLAVANAICTRGRVGIAPLGSARAVDLGGDDARSAELLAAMEWLYANELAARALGPLPLFKKLRGVATRSARGSAREALADSLRGISHVGAGDGICWVELPVSEVA
jgi:hypothetical protein